MTEVNQKLYESLRRFKGVLSDEDIQQLLEIQNQSLPTGIRLNSLKTKPEQAIQELSKRYGWDAQSIPFCETGWIITDANTSPGTTIEHRLGQYYIQDAASMVPVSLFTIKVDRPLVLDLAASPGGKTTHLVDRTLDRGFILANDAGKSRIAALRSVLSTWSGINLAVTNYPGEAFGGWYPETFDLVLLDAPCSMENLRPVPNHPLRQTTRDERLRLQERQIQLLISGLQALKIGGQLVYATCSLAPEENEAVIDALLQAYPHAIRIEDVSGQFGFSAPGLTRYHHNQYHPQLQHALRLWPHLTGMSGFFCALFVKTGSIPCTGTPPPARAFSKTGFEPANEALKDQVIDQILDRYGFNLLDSIESSSLELYRRHEQVFLVPALYLQQFITLPYEYIGMPVGRWVEGKLEPAHELFSRFGHHCTRGFIQIEGSDMDQWIAGRDLRHPDASLKPDGQCLLVRDQTGRNLGMGKLLPKRLRNMLPRRSI